MTGKLKIPGVIVPPVTPFNKDLKVDYARLKREVDYVIDVGRADAVVAGGVETQEYQYLTFDERKEYITRMLEFVNGRCYTVVGVSHPSIKTVNELTDFARERGADAVQLLAPNRPYGGPSTQSEVLEYFKQAAKHSDLPVVAYHNPGPGATLKLETMEKIASIDSVEAIKESSRNMKELVRLVESIEVNGLAHMFTTMEVLLPTLLLGASGGTMPAPASCLAQQVTDLFSKGKLEEAAAVQKKFSLFPGVWSHYGLAPLMKFALNRIGVEVGDPYPPFDSLKGADTTELARIVDEVDFPKP